MQLRLTRLENRLAPVVGATAPAPVVPSDGYTGVVRLMFSEELPDGKIGTGGSGTGTLFQTNKGAGYGHFILTAAHVTTVHNPLTASKDMNVLFNLARDGEAVTVDVKVFAGPPFQVADTRYQKFTTFNTRVYDAAVLRLTDQEDDPQYRSPERLLVAPFGAVAVDLVRVPQATGQIVSLVGYGSSGTGAKGVYGQYATSVSKRRGVNTLDEYHQPAFVYDFDAQGDQGANITGSSIPLSGEAMIAGGDSGGPLLIGSRQLVGINYGTIAPAGRPLAESPFGTQGYAVSVNDVYDQLVKEQVDDVESYDVVLDMHQQVFGSSKDGERLTIVAARVGDDLVLRVENDNNPGDAGDPYNGVYYKAPASRIRSLTMRGTKFDRETFVVSGDLGLPLGVSIDGRGVFDTAAGKFVDDDRVVFNMTANPGDGGRYTLGKAPTDGWDSRLSWAVQGATGLQHKPPINVRNIGEYVLKTGDGGDVVRVDAAPAGALVGVYIYTGGGQDDVTVGAATAGVGLSLVDTKVFVDGGDAYATLTFDDSGNPHPNDLTLGSPEAGVAATARLSRSAKPSVYSSNIDKFVIQAGTAGDTVRVDAYPAVADYGAWVYGNDGDDTLYVGSDLAGLDDIPHFVKVTGGGGLDALVVEDGNGEARGAYRVLPGRVEVDATIIHNEDDLFRTVRAGGNGNAIRVLGNPAGAETELTIEAGPGDDTITLAGEDNTLDGILGDLVVDGQGGDDELTLGDSGYEDGDIYTLMTDAVWVGRLTTLDLTYFDVETLGLESGTGDDTVRLDGLSDALALAVAGGGGDDELVLLGGAADDPTLEEFERLTVWDGTLTLDEDLDVQRYTQHGGVLDGAATLTASQYLTWYGGTMTGTGLSVAGFDARLDIDGTDLLLVGRTLRNNGFAVWVSEIGGDTGTFENRRYLYPGGYAVGGTGVTGGHYDGGGTLVFDLGGDGVQAASVTLSGSVTFLTPVDGIWAEAYTLVDNSGLDPVDGAFAGLGEGAAVWLDANRKYIVSYVGGDGNDVTLTLTQEHLPPLEGGGRGVAVVPAPGYSPVFPGYTDDPVSAFAGTGANYENGDTVELLSPATGPWELDIDESGQLIFTLPADAYWTFDHVIFSFQLRRGTEMGEVSQVAFYRGGSSFDPYEFANGGG